MMMVRASRSPAVKSQPITAGQKRRETHATSITIAIVQFRAAPLETQSDDRVMYSNSSQTH